MELRDYFIVLRQRWTLVVVCILGATLVAGLSTLVSAPVYQASSQLYVSVQTQDGSMQNLAQGSTFSQSQVIGFADLATSPLVLQPVIEDLGIDETVASLGSFVSATVKANTALIDVTTSAEDPEVAASLSNAVANSMAEVLPELQRPLDAAVSPVRITVTRSAVIPTEQSSPDPETNLALGAIIGLSLGVALAMLRARLDTRVRSRGDLESLTNVPVLGVIAYDASASASPLALVGGAPSQRAEATRRLRTNLQFTSAPDRPRVISVTSSLPSEGKSTTAANLALALADAGSSVVLVDADLRKPAVAKIFGLEGSVGLTTAIIGKVELADVVQPWGETTLDIVTAGEIPPNPSELLGSRQMAELLRQLSATYDIVLLDSAPLIPVTDGAVIAKQADGALVVVGAHSAHRSHVESALSALATVEATVLGLVLNRVTGVKGDEYSYAYGETLEKPGPRSVKQNSRRDVSSVRGNRKTASR